jgi:hypothetical protein
MVPGREDRSSTQQSRQDNAAPGAPCLLLFSRSTPAALPDPQHIGHQRPR